MWPLRRIIRLVRFLHAAGSGFLQSLQRRAKRTNGLSSAFKPFSSCPPRCNSSRPGRLAALRADAQAARSCSALILHAAVVVPVRVDVFGAPAHDLGVPEAEV